MRQTFLFSIFIGIVLIVGTGGPATALTPPALPSIAGFHVNIQGQITGPYDEFDLMRLISSGQITRSSLVWKEGMDNWMAASTVDELAPLFADAPDHLPPSHQPAIYQDFTGGQRLATWWLNGIIPGLGSFVIMDDREGGTTQIGFAVGTVVVFLGGIGLTYVTNSFTYFYVGLLGGGLLGTIGGVYNIYRSATYNRPHPSGISFIDNDAWNIAVIPGRNGIEAVALSYTIRY